MTEREKKIRAAKDILVGARLYLLGRSFIGWLEAMTILEDRIERLDTELDCISLEER